jgi:hypothetical protein
MQTALDDERERRAASIPERVRLEWARSRGRQAVLNVRFLDRLVGRPMADLGRIRPITEGRTNGSFPASHAPDLPFCFRPDPAVSRMTGFPSGRPNADGPESPLTSGSATRQPLQPGSTHSGPSQPPPHSAQQRGLIR